MAIRWADWMEAADDIEGLWTRYRALEDQGGDRATVLDALTAFVRRVEAAPPNIRRTWVDECLRASSDPKAGFHIRSPLFQRVLFPELKARYVTGDAPAARALAQLSQPLFRYRAGWEALGRPGEVDLWKEAYRRDPSFEDARAKLVVSTANFIRYTLHELPAGVLYGTDGATLEQCDDLVAGALSGAEARTVAGPGAPRATPRPRASTPSGYCTASPRTSRR
jgi:hypothetical protein